MWPYSASFNYIEKSITRGHSPKMLVRHDNERSEKHYKRKEPEEKDYKIYFLKR
jgi:hypothetical protein